MKYITNRRINVRTIKNLANNEGLTLRNGKIVHLLKHRTYLGQRFFCSTEFATTSLWLADNRCAFQKVPVSHS